MREILTRKRDIVAAVGRFRRAVAAHSASVRRAEWIFRDGKRALLSTHTIDTRAGRLLVGLPAKASDPTPHLFRLDREEGDLAPDVELNVPLKLDRKYSGVYARVEDGALCLCTRGVFTAYPGRVPRELAFLHFEKWLIDVADGDAQGRVIPVVALDAPTLGDDLVEFLGAVMALKSAYKQGEKGDSGATRLHWREPAAAPTAPAATFQHGLLCSALEAQLQALTHMNARYQVCRNQTIDVALVDTRRDEALAIFEVATSARLEDLQLAIGKLLYSRHAYGNAKTRLVLVAPSAFSKQLIVLEDYFMRADITIAVRDGNEFRSLDGQPLRQLLAEALDA
jgi:hypothetical protein